LDNNHTPAARRLVRGTGSLREISFVCFADILALLATKTICEMLKLELLAPAMGDEAPVRGGKSPLYYLAKRRK